MDHQEAVQNRAVERYLLREMGEAESASFEEHYFGCPECAAALETAAMLAANAGAIFAEQHPAPAPEPRRGWFPWGWPAVAFAAGLLVLVAYEEFLRVPHLKQLVAEAQAPQALPAFFLRPASRGAAQTLEIPRASRFVALSADLPPGPLRDAYLCRVQDARGRDCFTIHAPAPAAPGDPINLLVPVEKISEGEYTLVLSADSGQELQRFQFTLKYK